MTTEIAIQPAWNQRLDKLQADLEAQLTLAQNFLKYCEDTCSTKQELEAISHVILGLQIALDAMTNQYIVDVDREMKRLAHD